MRTSTSFQARTNTSVKILGETGKAERERANRTLCETLSRGFNEIVEVD